MPTTRALHLLLGFSALFSVPQLGAEDSEKSIPPNILFIAIDDFRPELPIYGASHIQSPNLDQLCRSSSVFMRAYCNIPVCGASRASLMTGARPTRKRFFDARTRKDLDFPKATSLPKLFKDEGYTTISNGKIYHHKDDDKLAWSELWQSKLRNHALPENRPQPSPNGKPTRGMPYETLSLPDNAYQDGEIAEKGIADLKKLKESGNPFFLALGFKKPHLPFTPPKKYWDLYDPAKIELPENYQRPKSTPRKAYHSFGELRNYRTVPKKGHLSKEMAKKLIHGYYASVSYIDEQVGRVLQTLEEEGLAENTIIVIWGDHGWNLGDHQLWCKHCTFETSTRSPLIIKTPGQTVGRKVEAITEFIDVYPTLCELAGIAIPASVDGESLLPLMNGEARDKNYAVTKFKDAICLIEGDLFYTEWIDDDGNAYERMLFDHSTDPLELQNLAEEDSQAETITRLAAELRKQWGQNFLDN